ncbi:MAG: hypothetical protein K2M11_02240, partial [Paramuribaculum sp.]|nr:hypothetical protein [Paramuribaculum sp.]
PVEDDSLISFAAEYYAGRGDSLEAQSLYYIGYFYSINHSEDTALVLLSRSHEAALAAHDIFYAAMSAREMWAVYRRLYMIDEGLKWARIARHLFVEAGKPVHAAWMEHPIADALIYNGEYTQAKELLDSVECCEYINDVYFRSKVLLNRIKLALQRNSYKEVSDIFNRLSEDNYAFTAHDRLNQAKAAIEEGMLEDADSYLAMARELKMSEADSLYEGKLLSKLYAARGDFRNAYKTSNLFGEDLMNSDMRQLSNPPTQLLTDNYKLKADNHRLQAARNRDYIIGLVIACMLLGALIYILYKYYKSMLVNKMHEIEHLVSVSQILREDLTLSNNRYDELTEENSTLKNSIAGKDSEIKHLMNESRAISESLKKSSTRNNELSEENNALKHSVVGKESEIKNLMNESRALNDNLAENEKRYRELSEENYDLRSSIAGKEAGFDKEIRDIFGRHLDLLNDLCEIWYKNQKLEITPPVKSGKGKKKNENKVGVDIKATVMYRQIVSKLNKLSRTENVEELAGIIDKYDNNWMTRFKTEFPDLKDAEYRLAIYRYLGFRTNTIAALFSYQEPRSVYIAKYRLKEKLSKMAKNQDALDMLKVFEEPK